MGATTHLCKFYSEDCRVKCPMFDTAFPLVLLIVSIVAPDCWDKAVTSVTPRPLCTLPCFGLMPIPLSLTDSYHSLPFTS